MEINTVHISNTALSKAFRLMTPNELEHRVSQLDGDLYHDTDADNYWLVTDWHDNQYVIIFDTVDTDGEVLVITQMHVHMHPDEHPSRFTPQHT